MNCASWGQDTQHISQMFEMTRKEAVHFSTVPLFSTWRENKDACWLLWISYAPGSSPVFTCAIIWHLFSPSPFISHQSIPIKNVSFATFSVLIPSSPDCGGWKLWNNGKTKNSLVKPRGRWVGATHYSYWTVPDGLAPLASSIINWQADRFHHQMSLLVVRYLIVNWCNIQGKWEELTCYISFSKQRRRIPALKGLKNRSLPSIDALISCFDPWGSFMFFLSKDALIHSFCCIFYFSLNPWDFLHMHACFFPLALCVCLFRSVISS